MVSAQSPASFMIHTHSTCDYAMVHQSSSQSGGGCTIWGDPMDQIIVCIRIMLFPPPPPHDTASTAAEAKRAAKSE